MNIRDRIPVCPHGSWEDLDFSLVALCDFLDRFSNLELEFTSGYRCQACNKKAGGAAGSAHLRGKAIDIVPMSAEQRYEILGVAFLRGIKRIGIAKDHIHLDVDETLPLGVVWVE